MIGILFQAQTIFGDMGQVTTEPNLEALYGLTVRSARLGSGERREERWLCVLANANLGLTTENFLDVLVDPKVKIGTSTPGDDPSGDYAFEVFALIDAIYPGAGATLRSRALQLVGGRNSPATPPGASGYYLITDGEADLFLSYCSNARLLAADPALSVVEIPAKFSPKVEYGWSRRKSASQEATRQQDFLMPDPGQLILEKAGFFRLPDSMLTRHFQ